MGFNFVLILIYSVFGKWVFSKQKINSMANMYLLTSTTTKSVQNKKLYILVKIIENTTTSGHFPSQDRSPRGPNISRDYS